MCEDHRHSRGAVHENCYNDSINLFIESFENFSQTIDRKGIHCFLADNQKTPKKQNKNNKQKIDSYSHYSHNQLNAVQSSE